MSPLWRDRIRIGFSPDKVTLVRLAKGWRPRVAEQRIEPCAPGLAEAPWQAPLAALKAALPGFAGGAADAEAVLSSAFVRYTLVPWSDQLSDEGEETAYARHCFAGIYGDGARSWAVRLSPETAGAPRVASAVEQGLLDGLASAIREAGLSLRSVRPHLMAAFNPWRHLFTKPTLWFAVAEGGRLSLALLHRGQWHSLRTVKIGAAWPGELLRILDRERLLVGVAEAPREVFLFAPEMAEIALPADGGWTVHRLPPPAQPGLAPDDWARFAMAWGG